MGRTTKTVDVLNGKTTANIQRTSYNFGKSLTSTVTAVGVDGAGILIFCSVSVAPQGVPGATLIRIVADDVSLYSATSSLTYVGSSPVTVIPFYATTNDNPMPVVFRDGLRILASNPAHSGAETLYATVSYRLIDPG